MPLNFSKLDEQLDQLKRRLTKLKAETGDQLTKQMRNFKAFAREKLFEIAVKLGRDKEE